MAEVDVSKSGIYQIFNLINGKIYIGSAIRFRKRWDLHKFQLRNNKHENRHLQLAWNKYGEEAFEFKILEYVDRKNLLRREQEWLDWLQCYTSKIGYNISSDVFRSRLGIKSSPEHIAKIVAANIGQKRSKETRLKIGLSKKGVYLTEAQKQARRNYRHTKEAKAKIAERKDWKHSEEAKLKMSEARKISTLKKNQEFFANMVSPL